MRSLLREALREGLKCAESANPKVAGFFKPGDADHLRRWLNDRRAAAIFAKLTKGKEITQRRIVDHILAVLAARQLAEETDRLNATFAELEREKPRLAKKERRHAMVQFADGKVSQEALDTYLAHIDNEEAKPASNLDPSFVVRSDRGGSRKRTIFCRSLSDVIHRAFGRWYDDEVATMCEIALDCGEAMPEVVRAARRGRRRRLSRTCAAAETS